MVLDAKRPELVGIRGAKLVRLDVDSWHAADAISNEDLLQKIRAYGAERIDLKEDNQQRLEETFDEKLERSRTGKGDVFFAILNKEGKVAVVRTRNWNFPGDKSISMRIRSRLLEDSLSARTQPSSENEGSTKPQADGEIKEDAASNEEPATMNTLINDRYQEFGLRHYDYVCKLKMGPITESDIHSAHGVKCEATCEVISSLKGKLDKQIKIVYRRDGSGPMIPRDPIHAGGTYLVVLNGDAEPYQITKWCVAWTRLSNRSTEQA